jgi:hypothetical protein
LHCCVVKKFNHNPSFFTALSSEHHHLGLTSSKVRASSKLQKNINFVKPQKMHQMAKVRSTARVTREGEETEATETSPMSEVMRQSGLVVTEGTTDEGAPIAEAEQTIAEEEDVEEDEEDYSILILWGTDIPQVH